MRRTSNVVLIVAITLAGRLATAQNPAAPEPDHVPGELLIKFNSQAPSSAVSDALLAAGASELDRSLGLGLRHWKLGRGRSVEQALNALSAPGLQRWIEYAEPNYIYHVVDVPDDPEFARLWGLYNGGQTGGTKGADVHALEAWMAGYTGSQSAVVAVLDTGIDYNHPDLAANIWVNTGEIPGNGKDDDGDGYIDDVRGWDFVNNDNDPMDDYGHGTHVSGTIAGAGNNGLGVAGVNWRLKLMPLKWIDATGNGTSANAIKAINYAAAKKVRITSNSWGGFAKSKAMQDAIKNSGALFVAAAGNSGSSALTYPGAYSLDMTNVLTVAATDHDDLLADFSNFGSWVHLAAPGVDVYSTFPGADYATMSGTSMATPHVAGAAALVLAYNPTLTNLDLKNRLLQTVDARANLSGKVTTGGRLNVQKALGAPTPAVPVLVLRRTELIADADNDGWAEPGEAIQLQVTIGNLRFAAASAVTASLSANGTLLGTQSAGDIAPDGAADLVFNFTVDPAAPAGQTMNFTLDSSVNGQPQRSLTFGLRIGAVDVLLVDGAGAYEPLYIAAIQAAGYSYRVLHAFDEVPAADEMSRYRAVVWYTDYFDPAQQAEVSKYMDGRGRYPHPPRMFVTGQDVGYNMADVFDDPNDGAFYTTYLHASYVNDIASSNSLAGDDDPLSGLSMSIPLNGGDGARDQYYPDVIAAVSPAKPLATYSGDGQGALSYDAGALRLIYFSFGFEGIDSTNPATATRATVMKRVLDWLTQVPSDGNYAPVAVPAGPHALLAVSPATTVDVALDGSGSYDFDGTIAGYQWSEGATVLGTDPTIALTLGFGIHSIALTVTDATGKTGTSILTISVSQRLFGDDMETTGAAPWVTQGNDNDRTPRSSPPSPGATNLWHKSTRRGSDAGHSPVRSWYYGIDSQGNYATANRNWGRLISPAIVLPASQNGSRAQLEVSQLVNVEGGSYENAVIQISIDNGATWTDLLTRGSRSTAFFTDTVNLTSYMGKSIRIGFFIDTKDKIANGFEGWYVDDVKVSAIP